MSLVVFFRDTVASRFDLITGNVGDNRLYIAILEHWLAVVHREARLTSPIFFWPEPGTLGYSDCVALFLPPYAIVRALGFDRYLAFQSTLIATKAIGFGGMYLLTRRALAVDRWLALLGAVLFTISNAYYLAAGHAQLAAVAFVPVLWFLAWAYWHERGQGKHLAALLSLATCALLLALLLLTSFYIGWFTIFGAALLCLVSGTRALIRRRSATAPRVSVSDAGRIAAEVALAASIFTLSLVPFLHIYRPALHRLGGRPFEEVLAYTPEPWHALDTGPGNFVWGSLARMTGGTTSPSIFASFEFQRGWPPLLLVLFLATMLVSLRRTWASRATRHDLLALALGFTALLAWLLSVRLGRATAWAMVFQLVPGASAIRVPTRINLVANAMVVVVGMIGLGQIKAGTRGGARSAANAALTVFALALVVEQLNRTPIASISRARERATFSRIGPPPPECKQFYAVRPMTTDVLETAEAQIDAMLVALEWRVPTLNGWSGNVPPGWNLNVFDGESERRAIAWAGARGVAKNLCALDLTTGTWSRAVSASP